MKHDSAQRLVFDDESENEDDSFSTKKSKSNTVSPKALTGSNSKKRNPFTKEEEQLIMVFCFAFIF